jgi:tRNA(fMet)-specific endonuclease VapC
MTGRAAVRYVLDTDMLTALQRGQAAVEARVRAVDPDAIAVTVVTLYEQLRGRLAVVNAARNDDSLVVAFRLLEMTRRHLCAVTVLPFDARSAEIARSLTSLRPRIGTQDLCIAAITLAHDATLVTGNRRDFGRVPHLRTEDWTTA